MRRALSFCLILMLLVAVAATAQENPSQSQTSSSAKTDQSKTGISTADIAAAKASHKVWVNLDTGVYHKAGRWYGKTKSGKFMTEDEAKKAGYKAAKRD